MYAPIRHGIDSTWNTTAHTLPGRTTSYTTVPFISVYIYHDSIHKSRSRPWATFYSLPLRERVLPDIAATGYMFYDRIQMMNVSAQATGIFVCDQWFGRDGASVRVLTKYFQVCAYVSSVCSADAFTSFRSP